MAMAWGLSCNWVAGLGIGLVCGAGCGTSWCSYRWGTCGCSLCDSLNAAHAARRHPGSPSSAYLAIVVLLLRILAWVKPANRDAVVVSATTGLLGLGLE